MKCLALAALALALYAAPAAAGSCDAVLDDALRAIVMTRADLSFRSDYADAPDSFRLSVVDSLFARPLDTEAYVRGIAEEFAALGSLESMVIESARELDVELPPIPPGPDRSESVEPKAPGAEVLDVLLPAVRLAGAEMELAFANISADERRFIAENAPILLVEREFAPEKPIEVKDRETREQEEKGAVVLEIAGRVRERHIARDLQMFLYGDILTIGNAEILWEAVLFVALMAFQFFGYNRMLYVGLNPVLATAHRVRTRVYQYAYAALLSLVVIFSVWAVGVFLVTAMLIVPAATARNLARSAAGMFWWSIVVGLTSAVAGLLISAQPDVRTATGATVILCASVWFVISFIPTFVRRGASGRYPANGGSSGT